MNTITIGAGGGYGYISTPAVVIAAPTTGVRATATATVANGVVSLLTLTGGGSGYGVVAPLVVVGPPEDLDHLLTRASELIDDYTRTAVYAIDSVTFLPTDTDIIAAFRDATCAQVEFWLTSDEEEDILGAISGASVGGVSFQAPALTLAPRAARFLRNAGLYSADPQTL